MAKTVIGLMDNIDDARGAVRELVRSGIPAGDIGFMANEKHALPSDSSERKGNQAASGTTSAPRNGRSRAGKAALRRDLRRTARLFYSRGAA